MDDSALVHDLIKKDEDATIDVTSSNVAIITTSVDMVEAGMVVERGPQLSDLIDDTLIERELKQRLVPVEIRMLRFVFGIQMMTALFVATHGYIVYYILNFDETHKVALITMLLSTVCIIAGYVGLFLGRNEKDFIVVPLLGLFVCVVTMWVGAVCSLFHTMVPLLACASVMTQSCAVYAYSLDPSGRDALDPYYAAGYMAIGHVLAWLLGIFDFVREAAWVWAIVLFLFGFLHVAYATWQIANITRYCLSHKDRILALVHFYVDPALQLYKHLTTPK